AENAHAERLAAAEPVHIPAIADLEIDAFRLDRALIEIRHAHQRDVVQARILDTRRTGTRDELAKVHVAILVTAADYFRGQDLIDVVFHFYGVPGERNAEAVEPRGPIHAPEGHGLRLFGLDVRRSIGEGGDAV